MNSDVIGLVASVGCILIALAMRRASLKSNKSKKDVLPFYLICLVGGIASLCHFAGRAIHFALKGN